MNEKTLRILEYDRIIAKLADRAVSENGKILCRELLPSGEEAQVRLRLTETDDGLTMILKRGSPPMSGVTDIRPAVKRMTLGGLPSLHELIRVADLLRAARSLKSWAADDEIPGNSALARIAELYPVRRLEDAIRNAVLSEDEVADSASPELAAIRRKIRDLQNSIKEKLQELVRSQKYQKYMQESVVTMRGDRYVVPVRQEYRNEVPGMVHDASSTGQTLFIEPIAVVEANNSIRTYRVKEQSEIERILYTLAAEVSLNAEILEANFQLMVALDFQFAKAKLAADMKAVSPRVDSAKHVVIRKGRHPLIPSDKVVPIDFHIGEGFTQLIVTGPNTGGKTVSLKTVGLFTLMMQSGMHVPASEGTVLHVFGNVLADIGDEQSIEQSLSTFSSHMVNIVEILKKADANSLVLFDELGAGTDPTEGAALAMAIIDTLRERDSILVGTTHYSELKVYAATTPGVCNACCEFDVETLRPTYRLLIGLPGRSNAFAISQKLGLEEGVIHRAKEFLTAEDVHFEDLLSQIETNRQEAERERENAERYRRDAEGIRKETENLREKLNAQKEKMIREAREEARRVLQDAKREADGMIDRLRIMEREGVQSLQMRDAEEIRKTLREKTGKLEGELYKGMFEPKKATKPLKGVKAGDSVEILTLGQKGVVLGAPDASGEVMVQAGIMKIKVSLSSLKLIDEQKKVIEKYEAGRKSGIGTKSIDLRCDVRGLSLDEAIDAVDKYLDDASMAHLHEVTIVHGKGTGVLMNGIRQFLKKHDHVVASRPGVYGEGEQGVTVVELR